MCDLGSSSGRDAVGLTTCVAKCSCRGHDCKHVTISIPSKHDNWELCEISVEPVIAKQP